MRAIACIAALLAMPQLATAQDQAAFEAGLGECARYITAKPVVPWSFQTPTGLGG